MSEKAVDVPEELDWMELAVQASPQRVFAELLEKVRADAAKATEIDQATDGGRRRFEVAVQEGRLFAIARVRGEWDRGGTQAVRFFLEQDGQIEVSWRDAGGGERKEIVSIRQDQAGRVRFVVKDEWMRAWQFRRWALSSLFFGRVI